MPTVAVEAAKDWGLESGVCNTTSRRRVTATLLGELPEMVAESLTKADVPTEPEQVFPRFVPSTFGPNAPDIWVRISPTWSPERAKNEAAIREALENRLEEFFCRYSPRPSSFDVDIDWQVGCGVSTSFIDEVTTEVTKTYWPEAPSQ